MAKNNESVSTVRRAKHGGLLTFFFAIVSIIWIAPLFLVLMNSFKKKAFIFRNPFSRILPAFPAAPSFSPFSPLLFWPLFSPPLPFS